MSTLAFTYPGNGLLKGTFEHFRGESDRDFFTKLGNPGDPLHDAFVEFLSQEIPGIKLDFPSLWECEVSVPQGAEYGRIAFKFFRAFVLFVDGLKGTIHEKFWHANYARNTYLTTGDDYQQMLFYVGTLNPRQLDYLRVQIDECRPTP